MKERLRIWYVIDAYVGPTAGTEKQLLLLINRMVELGHEARLFVLRHTAYTLAVIDFPCPIESLEVRSLASWRDSSRMLAFRGRVRCERPDAIHAFFNDAAILIPLYCKMDGVRVFTSRRDMGFWHTQGNLRLLRLANRRADGIICNSQAVADLTHQKEAAPLQKLHVIHNGMAFPSEHTQLSGHRAPKLPMASPHACGLNFCLVANLRPIKRIEDLIKAAAIVIQHAPDSRFWIVGKTMEQNYAEKLKGLARELGLVESVHFLGQSSNPTAIMRQCRIGVLCSESEGLSNTLLEYMSCGLPSVCSEVGGNLELIQHGVNGLLYPCGDVDALAQLLLELVADPEKRSTMAAAARARAREFSVEALGIAHLHAYQGGLRYLAAFR